MWRCVLFDLGDTLVDNHPLDPTVRDQHIARVLEIWLRRRSMRSGDEFTPDERARMSEIGGGRLVKAVNDGLADVAARYWSEGREAPPGAVFSRLQGEIAAASGLVASRAELEELYVKARMSRQRPLPGAIELLKALRARGVKCGLVSNTAFSREPMDSYLHSQRLDRLLDVVVYSSEAGWRKPKAQVFQMALARLGLPAAGVAFVGDDPETDVAGAIGAGLAGLWYWGHHRAAEGASQAQVPPSAATTRGGSGSWPETSARPELAERVSTLLSRTGPGRLLGAAQNLAEVGEILLAGQ